MLLSCSGQTPCLPVVCGRGVRYCSGKHGGLPLRVDVKHLIFIRSAPYVLGVKHLISMVVRFLG